MIYGAIVVISIVPAIFLYNYVSYAFARLVSVRVPLLL